MADSSLFSDTCQFTDAVQRGYALMLAGYFRTKYHTMKQCGNIGLLHAKPCEFSATE
jgi:hypothetical protein